MYCITHEIEMSMISRPGVDCLVVECPPPAELDLDGWEFIMNLPVPPEEELIIMDMNAELLEFDLGLV